ncbi:hypothetical protein BOX15_Mlig024435g2 [Macrostomum lignano]|uniref:Protein phosphatase 1 regulatory subunit 21 N-terminal domain-containing protein n=1 Tax=Macrostomum lignano TaxID=282301 RepID=A0A267H373_9PLAT|nr:hypothetical protein BOX15_Mlig024435g2 [Macrostomum lignano]
MSQQQQQQKLSSTPGLSPGGSASPSPGGSGMQERYQRLATEYSKARQQVIVLKNGVLEEQKRTGQLTEELNTARQTLRKREVEADSLNLLNRQLQSRVDQLQESLESLRRLQHQPHQHSPSSGKVKAAAAAETSGGASVLEEELQRKIAENARLHQDLLARDEAAQTAAVRYAEQLSALETAAASARAERDAALAEATEARQSAVEERDRLAAQVATAAGRVETATSQLAEARAESAGLRRDAELLSGLLRHSEEAQVARRWYDWTSSQTPTLVRALKSLVDLHLHLEARLRAAGSWTESASRRLRACVAAARSLCRELPADRPELATDAQLLSLLRRCPQLADCLSELSEPFSVAVSAEHLSTELQTLNTELCQCLTIELPNSLRNLASLMTTAAEAKSRSQLADSITQRFAALAGACKKLYTACERKVNAESALRVSDDIAAGNKACLTAASTLVTKLDLLNTQVSEQCELIASRLMFAAVNLSSAISDSTTGPTAAANVNSLSPSPSPSSPSIANAAASAAAAAAASEAAEAAKAELAVLRDELQRRQDQLALMESRLAAQQARISQLEKDRERWMLEAQVLSTRLGKQQQSSPSPPPTQQQQQSTPPSAVPDGDQSSAVAQLRANFLEAKCTESEASLQLLDSRLMHAQLSAKTANQRLVLALNEAASLKDAAFQCREELDTTRRNYEEQLAAISDHVGELNRQLERKEDELNGLRAQFSSTVAKKKR